MITGDELVELMFTSMSDKKMVEALDNLGVEQPVIDEQYEIDLDITVIDDNLGISFVFEEIDGLTQEGMPCLNVLSFDKEKKIALPYNLKFSYNYLECSSKLGKVADFKNKRLKNNRTWLFKNEKEIDYVFTIRFLDDELKAIKGIIVAPFNESKVGRVLIENKE